MSASKANGAVRRPGKLQSVERACQLLEHLATCEAPQSALQVSRAMGIERTAAHRLLRTLAETGMASSDGNGSYSIGSRALTVGLSFIEHMRVRRVALPYMMDLSFDYTERPWSIVLAIFDGHDILLVERLWNPRTPLDSLIEIGGRMPVDRTAAGWAYLAQVPEEEAIAIVGAKRYAEIEPRLVQTRADGGVAFAHAELQPGIDALSAPILDATGRPVAVLIVGGADFESEITPTSPTAQRVLRIVSHISYTLAARR
jgi:IclR family transcriptional regulator, acetate operon repressor